MIQALLGLLLRHGLTLLSGYLVARGIADSSVAAEIVGGISAAAGLGLSALNKVTAVRKLNNAADKVADFANLNK